jgi:hypothetical protein
MKPRDVITGVQFLNDQYGGTFRLYESDADAILAALAAAGLKVLDREPTKAMVDAVESHAGAQVHNQFAGWWRAAFDAAEPVKP